MLKKLKKRADLPLIFALSLLCVLVQSKARGQEKTRQEKIELRPCPGEAADSKILCGSLELWENREHRAGRRISLHIVVLKARAAKPKPDPVFFLAGGPGQGATTLAQRFARSWIRNERDIVLVDQRGTGRSNPLHVRDDSKHTTLQDYLEPIFDPARYRKALMKLEQIADLRQYTTPIAMDDLDDVRQALGYDKINLIGGSYGTRAALVYMRRHEEHVRCAILMGVAPPSFRNPLYHAWGAQQALDRIFADCRSTEARRKAFPNLRQKFEEVLKRLEKEPAKLQLMRADTKKLEEVEITRDTFLGAVRLLLYSMQSNRKIPLLIMRAYDGKFRLLASHAIRQLAGLKGGLAMGMLMCVTGSEDLPRIAAGDIEKESRGSYWGGFRARRQMAVAKFWPRGKIDAAYAKPVEVATPTLIFSGTYDPVTPPRWGKVTAKHLENSLHVIVPRAHDYSGSCIEALQSAFLDKASVRGLDTTCVKSMTRPKFEIDR